MAELGDHTPSAIVKIVADGDIILVIGPEKVKLRVHSVFLKAVSRPFSAMLGPDWKEGHDMLGQDGPVELLLPEDNAAAMKLICAIIHHQNKMVPPTLTASDILEIAIAADKYECLDTLKFARGKWLQPNGRTINDRTILAAAAYLFQDAQAFKEITRAIIFDHDGPSLALSCKEVEPVMTWRVYCQMEDQRTHARLLLAEIMIEVVDETSQICPNMCKLASDYGYEYLQSLKEDGLWPTDIHCISEAIKLAEQLPDPALPEWNTELDYESQYECERECENAYNHMAPQYRNPRCTELKRLNSYGLCLHCVRSDSITSGPCQAKH